MGHLREWHIDERNGGSRQRRQPPPVSGPELPTLPARKDALRADRETLRQDRPYARMSDVKEWQKETLIGIAGGLFVGLIVLLISMPDGIPLPGK